MQSPRTGQTTYFVDSTGQYIRMIIATKTDYGTDQAKKFTGRLRNEYIPAPASGAPACSPAAVPRRAWTSSTGRTGCSRGSC